MTLREPRGDESDEKADERLDIMGDKETSRGVGFPPTPFLLVEEFKEKDNRYLVVESWEEGDIQVLRDCHFMQNIEFEGHEASKEEIEEFSRGDNK
jgi:hypothetical protein